MDHKKQRPVNYYNIFLDVTFENSKFKIRADFHIHFAHSIIIKLVLILIVSDEP